MKKIFNLLSLSCIVIIDLLRKEHPARNNSIHIEKAIQWLCLAQDSTDDGGVSEGYHLFHGWLPSYPETTGYIIETFFDYFHKTNNESIKARAVLMADWLLSIQNDDGSISDSYQKNKLVFDTGQVIFGFVRTYKETNEEKYKVGAIKAGEWLMKVQEKDGTWQKYAINQIPHTYYTRVAWSLLVLHDITTEGKYIVVSKKNIEWALSCQRENGWFDNASFSLKGHDTPFTHTIAYTVRGILEAGLYLNEKGFKNAVIKTMDCLLDNIPSNGNLYGTYNMHWGGDKGFSCLTGNAQFAIILYKLYQMTKNDKYLLAANNINNCLKRKHELRARNTNIHGAIAGSYPVWGKYIHFTYPNWATKFFVDSLLFEEKMMKEKAL